MVLAQMHRSRRRRSALYKRPGDGPSGFGASRLALPFGQRAASEFLAARSYRYPNGAGREASTFPFASGNWLASGREQSVAPRRLVDHKFQVRGKKIPLVNQAEPPVAFSPAFESATISHGEPPASGCFRICDREGEIDAKARRQGSLHHRRR